jgi:methyl-accepting chemotaxis protein
MTNTILLALILILTTLTAMYIFQRKNEIQDQTQDSIKKISNFTEEAEKLITNKLLNYNEDAVNFLHATNENFEKKIKQIEHKLNATNENLDNFNYQLENLSRTIEEKNRHIKKIEGMLDQRNRKIKKLQQQQGVEK